MVEDEEERQRRDAELMAEQNIGEEEEEEVQEIKE